MQTAAVFFVEEDELLHDEHEREYDKISDFTLEELAELVFSRKKFSAALEEALEKNC